MNLNLKHFFFFFFYCFVYFLLFKLNHVTRLYGLNIFIYYVKQNILYKYKCLNSTLKVLKSI